MALINKLIKTMDTPGIEVTPRFLRHASDSSLSSLVQEIERFREELTSLPTGSKLTFTTTGSPEDFEAESSLKFVIDATLVDSSGAIRTHQLILDPGEQFAESVRLRLRYLRHLASSGAEH